MTESTNSITSLIGNWNELKVKFPTLTDADLLYEECKKDEMLNNVQLKVGITKQELAVSAF